MRGASATNGGAAGPGSTSGPIELRSGPLAAEYDRGALRWLRIDGTEIVRSIYAAVRDANWGTVEPVLTNLRIESRHDGFEVAYKATCNRNDIAFTWECRIEADGPHVRFVMDGRATRSFMTNRIGLCLLHPDSMAGQPVTVDTLFGTIRGRYPDRIAALSCFTNIRAVRQRVRGGGRVSIVFNGDVFEMEDQRNWTDASFKTFSRPLSLPAPWQIDAGASIHQEISVSVEGHRRRPARRITVAAVTVGGQDLGPTLSLGLSVSAAGTKRTRAATDQIRALRLAHLRLFASTSNDAGPPDFDRQLSEARDLGAPVELEIVTNADGFGLVPILRTVLSSGLEILRVLVFDQDTFVTTAAQVLAAREACHIVGVRPMIGGGSRADFYELNQYGMPSTPIDVLAYRVTPQIHAFDEASIVETIGGQTATVRSAMEMAGNTPIAAGPVTLRQLFNPVASQPTVSSVPIAETDDSRQSTLFCAAWTLGSIAALSESGAASATYHRTLGPGGLMPAAGERGNVRLVHPVYHVMADTAWLAGGSRLPTTAPAGSAALAARSGNTLSLLIANLENRSREMLVRLPRGTATRLWLLDESKAGLATTDPEAFRRGPSALPDDVTLPIPFTPYAIAKIERTIGRAWTTAR